MTQEWFYEIQGQIQGPVSSSELLQLARSELLQPTDIVWAEGMPRGAASRVRGLFEPPPLSSHRTSATKTQVLTVQQAAPTEIPCRFSMLVDSNHDLVSPTLGLLVRSLVAEQIVIRLETGDVVNLPFHELKVLGTTSDFGLTFISTVGKSFSKERQSIHVAAGDLEPLVLMMPNGHLVKLAAQQAIENRDFMVALNAKNVPVVWTIVILCVGAFILQLITANGTHAVTGHRSFDLELSPQDLVRQGGDYLPAILRGGWHRLLVSGFLHSSILHLVMNMFALVQIGPFCERLLGSRSFLIIYLAALLGSAWVSGVSYGSSLVSVGASGAIFGVIGIMLAAAVRGAVTGGIRRKMYGTAATFVAYQFLAEFQGFAKGGSGIDQIAHGSGLLIGFLICLSSVALVAGGQLQVSIKRVASVAAGFLLVVFVGGASFIPSKAWEPKSCLDEAVEDLSDSERITIARLNTGYEIATLLSVIDSLRNSRNLYALYQRGWLTGELLSSKSIQAPDAATIDAALEASQSCPDTHAVWLRVRALAELRAENRDIDMDLVVRAASEALQDLEKSNDKDFHTAELFEIVNLFNLAEYDPRMAKLTGKAWTLAATDPTFLKDPDFQFVHVTATIAFEMTGQPSAAAKSISYFDSTLNVPDELVSIVGVAFYLHSDAPSGRPFIQRAIAVGMISGTTKDFWDEVFKLPDTEAVKRVRADMIPSKLPD